MEAGKNGREKFTHVRPSLAKMQLILILKTARNSTVNSLNKVKLTVRLHHFKQSPFKVA